MPILKLEFKIVFSSRAVCPYHSDGWVTSFLCLATNCELGKSKKKFLFFPIRLTGQLPLQSAWKGEITFEGAFSFLMPMCFRKIFSAWHSFRLDFSARKPDTLAGVFYNVKSGSSFITSKNSSENLSNHNKHLCFCCLQDKTWIKMLNQTIFVI